jgi:hypothetical protein
LVLFERKVRFISCDKGIRQRSDVSNCRRKKREKEKLKKKERERECLTVGAVHRARGFRGADGERERFPLAFPDLEIVFVRACERYIRA